MASIRFKVKFGEGMPDDVVQWATHGIGGFLDVADNRLRLAGIGVSADTPWSLSIEGIDPFSLDWGHDTRFGVYSLEDLRFVAYEAIGTKSNIGALALFGTLGLGARKQWTLITVGFSDRDGQFLTRASAYEVRSRFQMVTRSSPTLSSLVVEGSPPSSPTQISDESGNSSSSPLDELERLASLYTDGLLTEDEFRALKSKLISGS